MNTRFKNFFRDESGAITVDWVVLSAAVVALGVAAGVALTTSTTGLSANIWIYLDGIVL